MQSDCLSGCLSVGLFCLYLFVHPSKSRKKYDILVKKQKQLLRGIQSDCLSVHRSVLSVSSFIQAPPVCLSVCVCLSVVQCHDIIHVFVCVFTVS